MSYSNKRYSRQEDDHLPQVFQRLGNSSRPHTTTNTTTTYTARTQRYDEGGGLRIARYNSPNPSQHYYPDYSKISQLRDDAVYFSPNNEYAYTQPVQAPTNNFRFVRADTSSDVSRPIISFLRDPPVPNQPLSPPSPSSYNNSHYSNTHQMNNRRVINEQQQDHLYQEQEQQQEEEVQEQTYNDRINIDIAKKIRITASIPSSSMSNEQLDNNDVGSNVNNNKQLLTPKRKITVTAAHKDRSSSSERRAGPKRARQISPISRTKRTRSPSPPSETSYRRRPRRSSIIDYDSDEDIPFLHLKSDTYIPNYAKEDNINNRLSGVKKFKDLRSYPPLGSTTESLSHNKVWKKPDMSSPLPLSKKFTPGATKTVDVTHTRFTSDFNANQSKDLATSTKKSASCVPAPSVSTSTESATAVKPVVTGTTAIKPAATSPKPTSSKPATISSKHVATHTNTPATSVTAPATLAKPTAETKDISSPKKPVETGMDTATNPVEISNDKPEKTADTPVKHVSFVIKPASKPIKPSTKTNKASIEKGTNQPERVPRMKNRWDVLPTNLVKQDNVADNNTTTVYYNTSVSTVKHGMSNQSKNISKAAGSSVSQGVGIQTSTSEPTNSPSIVSQNQAQSQDAVTAQNQDAVTAQNQEAVTTQNQEAVTTQNQEAVTTQNQEAVIPQNQKAVIPQNQKAVIPQNQKAVIPQNQDASVTQNQDALNKEQEHSKKDQRAKDLLRQLSIEEREDVVMDIEPPPSRNRPVPILNIHSQCQRYQSSVTTILKEEPMSDNDIRAAKNEPVSVYNSVKNAIQSTVDTIIGEFIGASVQEEKNKHAKKLPDINTHESVLSSNEPSRQLISPPVSSNTETPPVVLPTVADKPKASRSRLPAPWKVKMTDSGDIFYLNTATGETTPTRPV